MKIITKFCILILIIVMVSGSPADRLPSNVSDNQQFDIDTQLNASGLFEEETRIDWGIAKMGLRQIPHSERGDHCDSRVFRYAYHERRDHQ